MQWRGSLLTNWTGSSFTIPPKSDPDANTFRVLDHSRNVIFTTPVEEKSWHNIGIQVDWEAKTLAVLFSNDNNDLKAVTKAVPNGSVPSGSAGQGDFHWGVLKVTMAKFFMFVYVTERVCSS